MVPGEGTSASPVSDGGTEEAAHSLWLGVGSSLDPPKDWAGCQEDIEGVVAEECLPRGV